MSVRRALLYSYIEKYGSYVIALLSTAVISRLLGPGDIGAFAVGMALVGMVAVIREFGVSTYLVQEKNLTQARINAAFAITMGFGLTLGAIIAALALPVARFYTDTRVGEILFILAAGFVMAPLGSVSQSLLSREMRFDVLAWVRLSHSAVNAVVAILLAWQGLGPQSLAWAALAATASNAVLSFVAKPHRLGLQITRQDLKSVVSVGLPSTLVAIIDDLIASVPELVVGRWQGLAAAGLLSRSKGLSQMAHQLLARAAGPVFFSVFSNLQRDGEPVADLYVKATSCVCAIGWAMLALLAVLADPVVRLLFGAQWSEVGPLLRWMSLAAAVALLTSGAHLLLMASEGARDALVAKVWALPAYLVCTVAGALVNLQVMAIAYVAASCLAGLGLAWAVKRRVGVGLRLQLDPVRTSLAPAIGGALAALPFAIWYAESAPPALPIVLAGGSAGVLAAALIMVAMPSPLRTELSRWRWFPWKRVA